MKPTIMVVGVNVDDCVCICDMFNDYAKYIDYETNITQLSEYDYNAYDIIIYDYDNIVKNNQIEFLDFSSKNIKIIITQNTNEKILKFIMNLGADIIMTFPITPLKIKHIMVIYDLIIQN